MSKLIASWIVLRWKFARPARHINLKLSGQLFLTVLPFAALTIVSVASRQIDTFILSLYRPPEEVGWYAPATLLISNLLLLPAILLQAIFPVLSKFHASSQDDLKRVYTNFFRYLLILGFALCLGTLVTADQFIALIFGPGFEQSALALRILSFSLFWMVGFANGPLLTATGRQNISTKFASAGMVLTIVVSLTITQSLGLAGVAIARILPGALFFIPMTLVCHRILGLQVPYELILKTFVSALLMAGAVMLALKFHAHILFAILLVAPVTYGLALAGVGAIGKQDVLHVLQLTKRIPIGNDESLIHK